MTTRPIDSKFRDILDLGFHCQPASNGGWVVWDNPYEHHRQNMIAAYTDTHAMLAGLTLLLTTPAPAIALSETTGAVQ